MRSPGSEVNNSESHRCVKTFGRISSTKLSSGALELKLLHYLTKVIARTRWQESPLIPFTRVLMLQQHI